MTWEETKAVLGEKMHSYFSLSSQGYGLVICHIKQEAIQNIDKLLMFSRGQHVLAQCTRRHVRSISMKVHFHFQELQCLKLRFGIASRVVMELDERAESLLTAEAKGTCQGEVHALCTGRVYNPTCRMVLGGLYRAHLLLGCLFIWPLLSVNSQILRQYPWLGMTRFPSAYS